MRLQRSASPAILTAILVAASAATGCVSTQDIESIQAQLSEIQRQVQQVQSQSSSKEDVENLDAQVGRQMDSLLKQEADLQLKLQGLSSQIEQLQSQFEDTNYRLSQLSQQIATTNQELRTFRTAPPPDAASPDPAGGAEGEDGAVPPGGPTGAIGAAAAVVTDPKALYDSAYNDYLKGNYDLAKREFEEYLANFPTTDLA